MSKREVKSAQHYERKAFAVVGGVIGRGIGRYAIASEPMFLHERDVNELRSKSMPMAKKAGELFKKSGDLYLKAGEYTKADIAYTSAIETYSGTEPKLDTANETRFRLTCAKQTDLAKKLAKEKEGENRARLEEGHQDVMFSRQYRHFAIISIVGLVAGLFFLSSNLTGNVIGSLNQTSSNWIGGVLFIIGLVGAFAYFRRK